MKLIETVRDLNPPCPIDYMHGALYHYTDPIMTAFTVTEPRDRTWSKGKPKYYCSVCRKYFIERDE